MELRVKFCYLCPLQISKLKLDSARKKGINPVTGRPLWRWADGDDGYRRPGKNKGKAKKLFHRDIQRGQNSEEILRMVFYDLK